MPKLPIDYQKCVIYKLVCNNLDVTEIYVGHTSDFIRRKHCHKSNCHNENSNSYNLKVYDFIRENGGWLNWNMIEIEKFPCNDSQEACKRERFLIENLRAMLNSYIPSRGKKEYQKEYEQANIETIKERKKDWYQVNINTNREKRKDYNKQNAETLKAVTNCECSGHYQHGNKSQHLKSKNHLLYCSQIN